MGEIKRSNFITPFLITGARSPSYAGKEAFAYYQGASNCVNYNIKSPHIEMGINLPDNEFVKDQLSPSRMKILRDLISAHIRPDLVEQTLKTIWDLRKHAVSMCYNFKTLPPCYDTTFESWLSKTSYTEKDKDKFRRELAETETLKHRDRACKCFIKAETYPEYKYPRPIKSRTDRFKAKMGPIFQGINECLFANTDYFIKKIPVNQRAAFLKETLGKSNQYDCTDFSSFEAHFIDVMIYAIEFPFYEYVIQNLPDKQWFISELDTLLKANICKFKDFIVESMSRASGEMNTSSGNGWCNLILFTYVARVKGATKTSSKFEGDDGICVVTPDSAYPTSEDYRRLGWICKLESHAQFNTASFCGLVADIDDLINVCDVRSYLADFGWTKQQYINASDVTLAALIRAKGYSAVYQYPGCPIIDALGHYALRITTSDVVRHRMDLMNTKRQLGDSRFKAIRYEEILEYFNNKVPVRQDSPPKTRLLVEKLFGVTCEEQIRIEKYLDNLTTKQNLEIEMTVPEQWRHNNNTYVNNHPPLRPDEHISMLKQYFTSIGLTTRDK